MTAYKEPKTLSMKVAILLCTMNGGTFLRQQLDSYAAQTHTQWDLWVSDDGSSDDTCAILWAQRAKWAKNRLEIVSGPRKGFAANFLSLVCNTSIKADCFAYSDQDDVWMTEKLALALKWLSTVPTNIPALYCSRTELVDATGQYIGLSQSFLRSPSFRNALTQNLGGGNTMVFNDATRQLLIKAGADVGVIAHDWWTYLAVSGCGGKVLFDQTPTVQYRQHRGNLLGANHSFFAPIISSRRMFDGSFRMWNTQNIKALHKIDRLLSPMSKATLHDFLIMRDKALLPRIFGMLKAGIYRQTLSGNLGLLIATLLKRI